MVAWVVLDRRHYRQGGPFALPLSTPLFPLPHLSPLLPYSYGHSYTTAAPQPLYNQSLTHSFYLDGGCTPPARSPLATAIPTHYPLPTSSSFFSHSCALFCTFLHFLALTKNSTPLFSIVSALFAQNTRGEGVQRRRNRNWKMESRKVRSVPLALGRNGPNLLPPRRYPDGVIHIRVCFLARIAIALITMLEVLQIILKNPRANLAQAFLAGLVQGSLCFLLGVCAWMFTKLLDGVKG